MIFTATLCLGGCIESERVALLDFKNGLSDPSDRLSDWVADGSECCTWTGVVCHNITAHVLELHLRTLSMKEYYGVSDLSLYSYSKYTEYYQKSAFSGKVSDSLLELKYLSYLDLSYNDFRGVSIPKFIGSLLSLRYLNLSHAGFGGMIPPQLGNLSNLHYLNLGNMYNLQVENIDWVSSLSFLEFLDMTYVNLNQSYDWFKVMNSLPSLLELHLSYCRLPNLLSSLNSSSLSVLDLSVNFFGGPIPNCLQNMTSSFLRELDLSWNAFNSSIPNWLYDLTHLQLLDLRDNLLQGQISNGIRNLTSLVTLDLSMNADLEFENGIPKLFKHFCNLRSLSLSYVKLNQEMNDILEILSSGCVSGVLESLSVGPLSGYLSDHIGHLNNLRYLDVYSITDDPNLMIRGHIPTSFKHLCNLRSLKLSGIKLNQEMNEVLAILSGCVSNVLQSLELDSCELSGHLTDNISYFKDLITFDISQNSISGPIPLSFGEMNSLESVDLGDNRLEGEVSDIHFANLTRLSVFIASGNNISLRVSSNWIPPFHQLQQLDSSSWHIGPQFPKWLRLLKYLTYLDLSNTGISAPVPIWFWDSLSNYEYLNFSHNQMHGSIPNIPFVVGDMQGSVIYLNSNNFRGRVPYFSSNVTRLDLSNNSFSGSIFHFLCNNTNEEKQMEYLNLERNFLHGKIPDCWTSWKYLVGIKLSNNKFSGNIPDSIGTISYLQSLHLRNNNLSGQIPYTIQNCKMLFFLDLSENHLVGNIPTWIGDTFGDMFVLNLSVNKFDGYLPEELCHLVSLHILDLAHNNFSGTIPSCFSNFTGMIVRNDSTGYFNVSPNSTGYFRFSQNIAGFSPNIGGPFMESTSLVMKGNMMEYNTILRLVRSIDLSDNNFSGKIPTEITNLEGLGSLNLSQNALTGRIPESIGDMRWLEVIDFSQNQLSGHIPENMSRLSSLSSMNLSYNNLSGKIPLGTQLQSLDQSSFTGNQLCGLPLIKSCNLDDANPETDDENEKDNDMEVDWFYLSMLLGFVVGFWGAVGSLIFNKRWRCFYFRSLSNLWEKIWWKCFGRF
ncbi:Receptor-like protein EIX2 [Euphorbia peplus]|nr:Receptor-like protein EIX2 [Euphorbia peplus]